VLKKLIPIRSAIPAFLLSCQTSKQIFGYNELILDSEIQTSNDIRLFTTRGNTNGIDLDTGETFTLDILTIQYVMFKLNNGELQFEKSWEISRAF